MPLGQPALGSAGTHLGTVEPSPKRRAAWWFSWLFGAALFAGVVIAALHFSEEREFVRIAESAEPWWLAVAFALQAGTYVAQGETWRVVTRAARMTVPWLVTFKLSLAKLFIDQALPSAGISGTVVVVKALENRGLARGVVLASVIVDTVSYYAAYVLALALALVITIVAGHASPLIVAAAILFAAFSVALIAFALVLTGRKPTRVAWLLHVPVLKNAMALLEDADRQLARRISLIVKSGLFQLAIVALDASTVWVLIRSLGNTASPSGVFASFMISTLLRTLGIFPGGLGTFEAASVVTLKLAGVPVAVALAATLLFRGLSFWLPMLPGLAFSRAARRATSMVQADRPEASANGLSEAEAAQRLAEDGPNTLERRRRSTVILPLLARFKNPLVLLLLAASALEAATGELASAMVIVVVIVLSISLDFLQEHRAGRAVEGLRRTASVHASVVRDGKAREVPTEETVAGDVVLLSAGDLVPADGKLLEARDLFVNQALLTGEPYPVEKRPGPSVAEGEIAAASGMVFMGTSVISGSARAVITQTGPRTAVGQIGLALTRRPPPTEFEVGTRNFGLLILRLALLMILFVIFVNLVRGRPWLESFMFAIALAVGLTPELLPMVVSVALARGALRMSSKKVLVKRLAAIHDLGSMDVLCTDKTGTLTEARITLDQHLDPEGKNSARVLELAYLNSHFETGLKSPLDDAILAHSEVDIRGWEKIDEVPFDFERRRVSVLAAKADTRLLVIKGAFEDILELSSKVEGDGPGQLRPLDDSARAALTARFEALGREGYRVLGIAWKAEAPDCPHIVIRDEAELVFAGFAVFQDPPKRGAGAAMRGLDAVGVSVVIVTGDNELVATHVCRELGVPVRGVLTGEQLEALDEHALAARVLDTNLFCRLNPTQKNRVILAFKKRGRVVGYLGDGINDAPALHSADVGISVDDAADVAKGAADLVLLERDLAVIEQGILEGRRTLGNVIKYILMGTSSNFGNMFSMAGASVFLPFLPMLPMQILVNNFLYDVSEVPIPSDEVDEAFVRRPHRWDMRFIRAFMTVIGPVSSLFDFATFFFLLHFFARDERLFHTGWFVESLATQVLVIFVIRTQGNPLRSRASRPLVITSLAVVAVALLMPFTPFSAKLGFVALPITFYAMLVPLVLSYLVAVQSMKRWFYRHHTLP